MKKRNKLYLILLIIMSGTFRLNAQIRGNADQHFLSAADRMGVMFQNPSQAPGARLLFQKQGNRIVLESHIKVNVLPDLLIVHFAVQEQAETVQAAMQLLDSRIELMVAGLNKAGVSRSDVVVDFIQSQRVYGFDDPGESHLLTEHLEGFEIKKNVIFRLTDPAKFETSLKIAAAAGIFDLIKVDYIVTDRQKYQQQALDLALRQLELKQNQVAAILGKQALADREIMEVISNEIQPLQSYRQYTAAAVQTVDHANLTNYYRQRNFRILHAHKPATWYYDAQDHHLFDKIEGGYTGQPAVQIVVFIKASFLAI